MNSTTRRGASLPEAIVSIAAATVLTAAIVPSLARAADDSMTTASLENLRILAAAHAVYANDFDGRQPTHIEDSIATFAPSPIAAASTYRSVFGEDHPSLALGWGTIDQGDGPLIYFAYRPNLIANFRLNEPIVFGQANFNVNGYFGSHRFLNAGGFREYVDPRFYEPTFYAAAETVVGPLVEPLYDVPTTYADTPPLPGVGDLPVLSSYARSAAGMFDPEVMSADGWTDPWTLPLGFRSPPLDAARYAHLKTMLLEHHWLQNTPADPCNSNLPGGGFIGPCEPWYFNHGLDSSPATLFYDGSTRLLSNREALAADAALLEDGGPGTWSRTTDLGEAGYFGDRSIDGLNLSHHVLTVDGILGRDTLDPAGLAGRAARIRVVRPAFSGDSAPKRPRGLGTGGGEPLVAIDRETP